MEGSDDPVAELARVRGRKRFTMAEYAEAKARTRRMFETTDNPTAGKPTGFQPKPQAQPSTQEPSQQRTIAEVTINSNIFGKPAAPSRDATLSGVSVCLGPQTSSQHRMLASAAENSASQQTGMPQNVEISVPGTCVASDPAIGAGKETDSGNAVGSVANAVSLTHAETPVTDRRRATGTNLMNINGRSDILPQEKNCIADSTAHGSVMGTASDPAICAGTGNQLPTSCGSADASAPGTEVSCLTATTAAAGESRFENSGVMTTASTTADLGNISGNADVVPGRRALCSEATPTNTVPSTRNTVLNVSFVNVVATATAENDLISTDVAENPTTAAANHAVNITSAMNGNTCSADARGDGSATTSVAVAARALRSSSSLNNQNAANQSTLNCETAADDVIYKEPIGSIDTPATVAVGPTAATAPPIPRRRGRPPGSGKKKRTESATNSGGQARGRVTSANSRRSRHNVAGVEKEIIVDTGPNVHGGGEDVRGSTGSTLRENSSVALGPSDCQGYGDGSSALAQGANECKNATGSIATVLKSRGREERGRPPVRKRRRVVDVDALDLEAILGRNLDDYARKQEYHRLLHRQKEQFDRARSQRIEARKKQTRGFKDVDCSADDNLRNISIRNVGLRAANSPAALSVTGAVEGPSMLPTGLALSSDEPSAIVSRNLQEEVRPDFAALASEETGPGDRSAQIPETGPNIRLNELSPPSGVEKEMTNSETGNFVTFGSNTAIPVPNGSSNPEFTGSDTMQIATLDNEFSVDGLWGIENRGMPDLASIPAQSSVPRKDIASNEFVSSPK
jgi:hypothetical protein